MSKIPLKINTSPNQPNQNRRDIKNALNLNLAIKKANNQKRMPSRWFFAAFFLFFVSLALAGLLIFETKKKAWEYSDLIPTDFRLATFFKISELQRLGTTIIPELRENSAFFDWLEQRIIKFTADSNLEAGRFLSLFEDKAVLAVLNQEKPNQQAVWMILAKTKFSQESLKKELFDKLESGLKRDFSLNESSWRQIKIKSVQSLLNPDSLYFYAQINDYILIGNSQTALQSFLDKIIGR